jgi:nitrate/nitrite transport system substrate-binding protein
MASDKRDYTFAQTFPTGTHAMWLYYWLAAAGINPMKDAKVITVPPPQMVANMRVGNMDGFCVGEPWNHRAIIDGIGITAATTQDIWKDHPEKVLGTTGEFVKKYPNTSRAVIMAVLEAGRWIDAGLQNKNKMAETIADKAYVNTSVDAINQRILGRYQNGLGKTWDDPNHMKFFNDGAVNYPYLSDGMWFLTQHKRWGLLKDHPDYLAGGQAGQPDRALQAGRGAAKVSVPKSDMRSSKLIDGVVWDGKDPAKYADGFKVKPREGGARHGQCRLPQPRGDAALPRPSRPAPKPLPAAGAAGGCRTRLPPPARPRATVRLRLARGPGRHRAAARRGLALLVGIWAC